MPEWPHFSDEELSCGCGCGRNEMKNDFMQRLEHLREAFNRPMSVSSAYRCPDHNEQVASTGRDGPHTTGRAIDIGVAASDASQLVKLALQGGMTGIGISQKGHWASRFVHFDDLSGADRSRPAFWSY